MLNVAALRAPAGNGQTLVAPAAGALAALAAANRTLLASYDFPVLGQAAGAIRQATRRALGLPDDAVVIGTGHQPEPIHAGVWAKHVVTVRLAAALDGVPLNLVVDNDAPTTQALAVPTRHGDAIEVERVGLPSLAHDQAYEFRPPTSANQIETVRSRVEAALADQYADSCMPAYFEAWAAHADARDSTDQIVAARRAIEEPLAVELVDCRVSRAWPNALAAHLILDAAAFAHAYNAALASYRRANGVRGRNRPIPDLAFDGAAVEVPLWIYGPGEPRRRMFVQRTGDTIDIRADAARGEPIGQLDAMTLAQPDTVAAAMSALAPRVVRPRALTLTLWARLFAADLFIHGIGGAKYDRITDEIIHRYFGVRPPEFACVSATLRLGWLVDLADPAAATEALRTARHRVRDLRYNPQRYVRHTAAVGDLVAARQAAIARSERLRADDPSNHRGRAAVFRDIRDSNASLLAQDATIAPTLADRLRHAASRRAAAHIAHSREFFFGLFARPALEHLCAALPDIAALRGGA